ncbi:MAG: ABC transporter ATP-binding protein [bacterium]|nr:ABC transporter ATP-binding protein [bacterium]
MEEKLLELTQVSFGYTAEKELFHNLMLQASRGEAIGLIGANGAGKSTLLKLLVGLLPCSFGTVSFAGEVLSTTTLSSVRAKIGYVFQDSDSQLFMSTVREDVAFAPRNYGLTEAQVNERVTAALEQTQILQLADSPIYQLSGGEKKLASIATILSMRPDMILLDEPSVALDPMNRRNLIQILNGLSTLKLIASHDLDFIWDTCERTIVIGNGQIVADGPTAEIMRNERILRENHLELPLSLQRRTNT